MWRHYPAQMLAYWWSDWVEVWRQIGTMAARGGT